MARLGLCYEVGQGEVSVGACYQVGVVAVDKLVLHALGHAAQHAYYEPPSAAAHGVESLQAVEYFLLVFITEATTSLSATFIWQP